MRRLRTLALGILILIGPAVTGAAAATTAAQLVELMKAGLGDDVLIALIQTDGSTFHLSADDILQLHRQGLSDKVIRAMQETARKSPAAPPTAAEPPDATQAAPVAPVSPVEVQQVLQPTAPSVVNVFQTVTQRVEPAAAAPVSLPFYGLPILPAAIRTPVVAPATPVYWGWGGQRRPDSWDPRPAPADARDAKTPAKNKGGR